MAEPSALELQAHVIMTAMEAAHKVIVEDFWQRGGRAWLKYYNPDGDGQMWTLTITPHPMEADLSEAQCFQVQEARDALGTWDLARDPGVTSRESVLADQVRALLAIIDAVAAPGEGSGSGERMSSEEARIAGTDWAAVRLSLAAGRTVPDGCELVAVADPGWRIETGKLCARRVRGQRNCREPSLAELNRRQYRSPTGARRGRWVDSWWPYCLPHFLDYGHWIEDGKVMTWILQETEAGGPHAPGA